MSRPPQEPTGAQHTAHAWKRPSTHVVSPLAPMAPSAKMMAEVVVASPQTYSWNTHTHFLARYRNGYCIMSHKLTAARGGQRSQHSVRGQYAQGRAAQNGYVPSMAFQAVAATPANWPTRPKKVHRGVPAVAAAWSCASSSTAVATNLPTTAGRDKSSTPKEREWSQLARGCAPPIGTHT